MAIAELNLTVDQAELLNPLIRHVRLRAGDGQSLPEFTAGAHIMVQVTVNGVKDWRNYSLINFIADREATGAPKSYDIAVRIEPEGRGGSRFMHETLQAGNQVTIQEPKNDFPLQRQPGRAVLVAGGIGITPLASMAAQCRAEGAPVRLHYAGRSRNLMAFLPELQALLGDDLVLHTDDEAGHPLDIDALLDSCAPDDQLYVCGPRPLLDKVLERTQTRGWTRERVHFELFSTQVVQTGDHAFEVVLAQSGRTLMVPADKSILDVLIDADLDPMYDCKRGECGVCTLGVIEGEVDHRDYFLSDKEKASGKMMQVCVSRCLGSRLVLDL